MTFGFPMFETPMTHANHIEIIEDYMASFGGPAHPSSTHLNEVAVICGRISTVPKGNNFLNHSSNHLPIYPSFPHHFPIHSMSVSQSFQANNVAPTFRPSCWCGSIARSSASETPKKSPSKCSMPATGGAPLGRRWGKND